MSTDLQRIERENQIIDATHMQILEAGLGCKNPAQAKVLAAIAISEGKNPLSSFRYEFVQNRPTKKPVACLEDYIELGGTIDITEQSKERCTIEFTNPNDIKPKTISFTAEEAEDMGLTGKDNYKKQIATMLFHRCLAKGFRMCYPKVLGQLYMPSELDHDLEVVEAVEDIVTVQAEVAEEVLPMDEMQIEMEQGVEELAKKQNKPMYELITKLTEKGLKKAEEAVSDFLRDNGNISEYQNCFDLSLEDSADLLSKVEPLYERIK